MGARCANFPSNQTNAQANGGVFDWAPGRERYGDGGERSWESLVTGTQCADTVVWVATDLFSKFDEVMPSNVLSPQVRKTRPGCER